MWTIILKIYLNFIKLFSVPSLVPYFPPSVHLLNNIIYDKGLHNKVKINRTANEILKLVNGYNNVKDIVDIMKEKYTGTKAKIERDIKHLIKTANSRNIINFKYVGGNFATRAVLGAVFNLIKGYSERFDIKGTNFMYIFYQLIFPIIKKILPLWLLPNFLLIFTLIFANISMSPLLWNIILFYNSLFVGFISSIALHETLHIYFFRKNYHRRNAGYFVSKGFSYFFVHSDSVDNILGKLLGSLVPSALGIISIIVLSLINVGNINNYFLVFSFTYAIHIVNLIPFWGDGKDIFMKILKRKYSKDLE